MFKIGYLENESKKIKNLDQSKNQGYPFEPAPLY